MRCSTVCFFLLSFSIPFVANSEEKNGLWTHQYTVPPTFLSGALSYESFRTRERHPPARQTAKEVLQRAGIHFGEGAKAIYNPSTSTLIVVNTKGQMELIEAYIDSIKSSVQVQVYVTINEMFFPDSSFDRLLKDLDENVIVHLPRIQDSRETLPERGFFAGSLPAPETQILIHRATIDKNVKSYPRPSLMVRAQQPGIIEVGQQRYGVTTHLTKENSQITISLYLPPPGENLIRDPNDLSPDVKATIWDGYTAVIKKTMEDGVTLVLVSAKTMDPAGQLINPDGGLKSLLKRKK